MMTMKDQIDEIRDDIKELLSDCGFTAYGADIKRNDPPQINAWYQPKDMPEGTLQIDVSISSNTLRVTMLDADTGQPESHPFKGDNAKEQMLEFIRNKLPGFQFPE